MDLSHAFVKEHPREGYLECRACLWACRLKPGQTGVCRVRMNQEGTLVNSAAGHLSAACLDPLEKKPLYHFLPGQEVYSLGSYGCNMDCPWCQNWEIAQAGAADFPKAHGVSPSQLLDECERRGIKALAFTYNEPVISPEYILEVFQGLKHRGIKRILVTNGSFHPETLGLWMEHCDAMNVDLKGWGEDFYHRYTGMPFGGIQENLARLLQACGSGQGPWIEISTLVLPGENDDKASIEAMISFILENNPRTPWHLNAFHPRHCWKDRAPTPALELLDIREKARKRGLSYVYVGNVPSRAGAGTLCPRCGTPVIQRNPSHYLTQCLWFEPGVCPECREPIPGVWSLEPS